jgi:hypothetical protein
VGALEKRCPLRSKETTRTCQLRGIGAPARALPRGTRCRVGVLPADLCALGRTWRIRDAGTVSNFLH